MDLQKREERHLAARRLGASAEAIARFESVAAALGPRMMLLNSEVYEAVWRVGLNRCLAQGRPLLPTNAERWAGEVWLELCHVGVLRSWEVEPMFQLCRAAEALWSEPSAPVASAPGRA